MVLSDKDRRLARLFTGIVLGNWDEVAALRRAAPSGEPDRAWRETLLQVHVFAGFPRAVEAYGVLRDAGGLGQVEGDEQRAENEQPARGLELFERIYGAHGPAVASFLRASHPDFADWILGHAYGRVLARPGLAAHERELLAVCALAAFGQERQLASHVRGALRCGAQASDVREVLESVRDLLGAERAEHALRVAARFT